MVLCSNLAHFRFFFSKKGNFLVKHPKNVLRCRYQPIAIEEKNSESSWLDVFFP